MNLLPLVQTLLTSLQTWLTADPSNRNPDGFNEAFGAFHEAFTAVGGEPERTAALSAAFAEDENFTTASLQAFGNGLIEFGTANDEHAVEILSVAVSIDEVLTARIAAEEEAAAALAAEQERRANAAAALAAMRAQFHGSPPTEPQPATPPAATSPAPAPAPTAAPAVPAATAPVLDPGLAPAASSTPTSRTAAWQLAVGIEGREAGTEISGDELHRAFAQGSHVIHSNQTNQGARHNILSIQRPLDFTLSEAAMNSPWAAGFEIMSRLSPAKLAMDADELVASGCCDFTRLLNTPVPNWQDAASDDYGLPRVGILTATGTGCKVKYMLPMLDSVDASYTYPGNPGKTIDVMEGRVEGWRPGDPDKSCMEVPCPTERECDIAANTLCFVWDYGRSKFDARSLEMGMSTVKVALARQESRRWFAAIQNLAVTRLAPGAGGLGMITYYLELFASLKREYVSDHRFPKNIVWNLSLPFWVADALILDVQLTLGDPMTSITIADIERLFQARGIRLRWRRDGLPGDNTEISQGAAGDPVQPTPETAEALFWHDGSMFILDGGDLNLGTIVDSDLAAKNKRKHFEESWDGLCLAGFAPTEITVPVCPTGQNKAKQLEATCEELRLAA